MLLFHVLTYVRTYMLSVGGIVLQSIVPLLLTLVRAYTYEHTLTCNAACLV